MRFKIPFTGRAVDFTFTLTSGNWKDLAEAGRPTSGVIVNEESSLQLPAVYACITLLSKTIASLPLHVFKRINESGRQRAPDHPLYSLLHDEANPEMSAMVWRETALGHLLLWGNSYSEIEYDDMFRPVAIWPLRPDRTWPERNQAGNIVYRAILPNGQIVTLQSWQVLHIPLYGFDGLVGKSPIRLMMETFSLSVAVVRYGGKFFGNGARTTGVLESEKPLSKDAQDRLRNSFDIKYTGLENSHRTMILEDGLKYKTISIPPEEAQFLESRNFNVTEIARIFGVPPHMIGDLTRSTNNNIEHQGIEFSTITIRPYCVRIEQEFTRKLLTSKERKKYFIEHNMDGLMRGDMKSRYDAHSSAINNGWMNPDEARAIENLNPMAGNQGQIYRLPMNSIPSHLAEAFWKARSTVKGGTNENNPTGTNV